MAASQNVEVEAAAKFLHKLIQDSRDEPAKLATKLYVICQHMKMSGKEQSLPYQVISRAMETMINQHGLDIEVLKSSRLPSTSGAQIGDSENANLMDKDGLGNPPSTSATDMHFRGVPVGTWHSGSGNKAKEYAYGAPLQGVGVMKESKSGLAERETAIMLNRPPAGQICLTTRGEGSVPLPMGHVLELQNNSKAAQFKDKPLENADELEIIFGGTMATEEGMFTIWMDEILDPISPKDTVDVGLEDMSTEIPKDNFNASNENDDDNGRHKRRRTEGPTIRNRLKTPSKTSELSSTMDSLLQMTQERWKREDEWREKELLNQIERENIRQSTRIERESKRKQMMEQNTSNLPTYKFSLERAMECLKEMDDISTADDLYLDIIDLLQDAQKRETFILLDHDLRRRWIIRQLSR